MTKTSSSFPGQGKDYGGLPPEIWPMFPKNCDPAVSRFHTGKSYRRAQALALASLHHNVESLLPGYSHLGSFCDIMNNTRQHVCSESEGMS